MVETALAIMIFLGFVGGITTISIGVLRYALLLDASSRVLREISTDATPAYGNCANLHSVVEQRTREYLVQVYGMNSATTDVTTSLYMTKWRSEVGDCRMDLVLTSYWEFPVLMDIFMTLAPRITVTLSREIEDAVFRRCGFCEACS